MTSKIAEKSAHWILCEALVRGASGSLCFEDYTELLFSISQRDVKSLFKVTARMDRYILLYNEWGTCTHDIRVHRQVVSFLKKFPFCDAEAPTDRSKTARDKLLAAEQQCASTNRRISSLRSEEIPAWVNGAKRIIRSVLGPLTSERIMKICTHGQHGPGATTATQDARVTAYYKYADFPYTCTAEAMPYALAAISSDPAWMSILESSGRRRVIPLPGTAQFQKEMQIFHDCVERVDSDMVTFVPKDAFTERPIAIGNSLNMYLQLGVKAYLQDRLALFGIDLSDQGRNQHYACLGSRHFTGRDLLPNGKQFSTIDLSSASDTISRDLVRLLLPSDWYALLDDFRHKTGTLDGETIQYEKFSAMGNGFTFPLETLIFWACSKAALDQAGLPSTTNDLVAYGDDIICRYEGARVIIDALEWSGFSVNTEKSFLHGPFKESCGADYFKGHDVRAFYLKRQVNTYEDVYFLCNSIAKRVVNIRNRPDLQSLYQAAVSLIPLAARRYIPMSSSLHCGLCVPLNWVRRNLNGVCYLNDREYSVLTKRYPEKFYNSSDPVCITEMHVPREYRGKSRIRLYISLASSGACLHAHASAEQLMHLDAASRGVITRRGKLRTVTGVLQVSNWDARYTNKSLMHHPIWFAK